MQTPLTGPPGRNLRRVRRQRYVAIRRLPFSSRVDFVGRHAFGRRQSVRFGLRSLLPVARSAPHRVQAAPKAEDVCTGLPSYWSSNCAAGQTPQHYSTAREVDRENAAQVTAKAFILHAYMPPPFFYLILFFLF
jgi:hypothetical protein